MRKLQIEAAAFLEAFDRGDLEIGYYLDVQTGAVIPISDDLDGEECEVGPAVEENPERYRYIDPVGSHESYRWMERFAHDLEDVEVRERLLDALDRQRPFRRFKDVLLGYPEVREVWFRSQAEQLRAYAEDWLQGEGLEAELIEPRSVPII